MAVHAERLALSLWVHICIANEGRMTNFVHVAKFQGRHGSSGSSDKPTRQAWLVLTRQKQPYRLLKK